MEQEIIKINGVQIVEKSHQNKFETPIVTIISNFLSTRSSKHTILAYQKTIVDFCQANNVQVLGDLDRERNELIIAVTNYINSFKAQSTKRQKQTILRNFFVYLQEVYLLSFNPVLKSHKIKVERKKSNTPSMDLKQLQSYYRLFKGRDIVSYTDNLIYCIYSTLLETGLRISEILQFKVKDLEQEYIEISQKGGRARFTCISADLKKELKKLLDRWDKDSSPDAYIFQRVRSSEPIRYNNATKLLKEATNNKYSCHSIRKSIIENMLEAGYNPSQIARVSGHASLEMVNYYDNRTEKTTDNLDFVRKHIFKEIK